MQCVIESPQVFPLLLVVMIAAGFVLPMMHFSVTRYLSLNSKYDVSLSFKNIGEIFSNNLILSLPIVFFVYISNISSISIIPRTLYLLSILMSGIILLFYRILSKTQSEPVKERVISFVYSFYINIFIVIFLFMGFSIGSGDTSRVAGLSQSEVFLLTLFTLAYLLFITIISEIILMYGGRFLTNIGKLYQN